MIKFHELESPILIVNNFSSILFLLKTWKFRFIPKLKNISNNLDPRNFSFHPLFLQFIVLVERTRRKQKLENSSASPSCVKVSIAFDSTIGLRHNASFRDCVESGNFSFPTIPTFQDLVSLRSSAFNIRAFFRSPPLPSPLRMFPRPILPLQLVNLLNKKIWSRCVTVS